MEAVYKQKNGTGEPVFERVRLYAPGPDGIAGAVELAAQTEDANDHQALVYHYDHLGSIDRITNFGSTAGLALDWTGKPSAYSHDAWGERRDPSDWLGSPDTESPGGKASFTPKGYTGHEMLDDLGLVHMNGRIYDPLLGRFLSADTLIQAPNNLQSYNRYSYVFNNPLSLTDPSGFETIAEYEERIRKAKEEGAAARKAAYEKDGKWGLVKNWFSKENRERGQTIRDSQAGIEGIQSHADALDRFAGVKVDAKLLDDASGVYAAQEAGLRFFKYVPFASAGGKATNADFKGALKDAATQALFYAIFKKIDGLGRGSNSNAGTFASDVVEQSAGSASGRGLGNAEVRAWYNAELRNINTSGPLTRETAEQVHLARNELKQRARDLMSDRAAADQLAREQPLRSFDYYMEKYSAQGLEGEGLWARIIEGGTTPNKAVNKQFGID